MNKIIELHTNTNISTAENTNNYATEYTNGSSCINTKLLLSDKMCTFYPCVRFSCSKGKDNIF